MFVCFTRLTKCPFFTPQKQNNIDRFASEMDKFQVIYPSILLTPYVKQYWFLTLEDVMQGAQRYIPNGCIILTFQRGGQIESSLSGQQTSFSNIVYSGNIDFISIVFQPTGAMGIFKMPMVELNNQNIPLDTLNDPQILELEKRIKETSDNKRSVQLIENFLLKRIYQTEQYNYKRLLTVIDSISLGQYDVSLLAQIACLGYKQFKRVFAEHIGINPKDFIRIKRYQKAAHILQIVPQISLTQLAEECAYYDKSHLIREFKEFSGYTPKDFLSVCDPYSEYHSLFRSAMIDIK